MGITESNIERGLQIIIDSTLQKLQDDTFEMGLGEMDEYEEISSINRIEVDRIVPYTGIKVYVNLYVNNEDREDFNNVRSEIQYRVSEWVPNIVILIDSVIPHD